MVTDVGGIGDLSFNMMAKNGLDRAANELGVKTSVVESQQVADYGPNLQRLAERECRVVYAVGYALEPAVKEVAAQYPKTHFVLIDAPGGSAPNVTGVVFREEEGSFLAGALAGGMTKTNKLGFVGGMEIELIKRFQAGYEAGARTTNPAVTVSAKYTNNWEDVGKGKELALALYGEGADIVYHASGRCGIGVIDAAKQKGPGFWAIGVDADQDHLGNDPKDPQKSCRVLTSMMKRVDNAVFTTCKEASEGTLKAGTRELGVKDEGVGLSPMKFTRSQVPDELMRRVEDLKARVASGEIKPPRTLAELASWQAPAK
jgi:basic membrane protein A and related proteins